MIFIATYARIHWAIGLFDAQAAIFEKLERVLFRAIANPAMQAT
jgi:hypothetical protein